MQVDRDQAGMLDLLELALTWGELDYEAHPLIEPSEWDDFLEAHRWQDQARAARVFSLANDIARRSSARVGADDPLAPMMSVFSALTGQLATAPPPSGALRQ